MIENDELEGLSSKRKASYYKAHALTLLEKTTGIDYDLVVTIDSNVEIVGDLDEFVDVIFTLIMIFLCHRIPIVKTICKRWRKSDASTNQGSG